MDPLKNYIILDLVELPYEAEDTVFTVNDATELPDPSTEGAFNLVVFDYRYRNPANDPNREIIRVNDKTGNNLEVDRAREDTIASPKEAEKSYKVIMAVTAGLFEQISNSLDKKGVFVEDFGARGDDDTFDNSAAIIAATETGRPVIFSDKTYYWEEGIHCNNINWVGVSGKTVIKRNPNADHVTTPLRSTGSLSLEGVIIDNSSLANRVLEVLPESNDDILIYHSHLKNALQPADDANPAEPIGLNGTVLRIGGECRLFQAVMSSFTDADAHANPGGNRPTSRGIDFDVRNSTAGCTDGIIHGCTISNITCGDNWGRLNIDADGLVWRGNGTKDKQLRVYDSNFKNCAKRFIKGNTEAKNLFIDDSTMHVEAGKKPWTLIGWQEEGSGHCNNCKFIFDKGEDMRTLWTIAFSSGEIDISKNTIIAKDSTAMKGARNQEAIVTFGGEGPIENIDIYENKFFVEGGLPHFAKFRMTAQRTDSAAKAVGVQQATFRNNYIQKLNGEPFTIDRSGTGHTYQKIRVSGNVYGDSAYLEFDVNEETTNLHYDLIDLIEGRSFHRQLSENESNAFDFEFVMPPIPTSGDTKVLQDRIPRSALVYVGYSTSSGTAGMMFSKLFSIVRQAGKTAVLEMIHDSGTSENETATGSMIIEATDDGFRVAKTSGTAKSSDLVVKIMSVGDPVSNIIQR